MQTRPHVADTVAESDEVHMQGDDRRRLAAVRGSGLMVGRPDPTFDRAARTVARCTNAPVAWISVLGAARQHFVGQVGLEGEVAAHRGTPIAAACCRYVVAADAPVVADDVTAHPDLAVLPPIDGLVVGAYAGVPLHDADGIVLGAVCAIDHAPRAWTPDDVVSLEDVAGFLQAHLTLRATTRELRGIATTPRTTTTPRRGARGRACVTSSFSRPAGGGRRRR